MTAGFFNSSQKALWIDLELEIAFGLRAGGKPLAQILRQIDAARRLHQQAEPIAALDHRKRGFGGSQHLDPLVDRRDRGQPARKAFRGGPIARRDDQAGEPAERWIEGALARLDLAGIKRLAVARHQRLHHGMLGLMGLQIADPAALVASGPSDHLVEQLKRPLGGARIAIAQAEVGIDHADQIEPRKMMATRPAAISFNSLRMVSIEVIRSLDSTMVRASGNRLAASSCSRSTPGPTATSDCSAAQCGQASGRGIEKPQWWQTRRWRKR